MKRTVPKMAPASNEMKRLAGLIEKEIAGWPGLTTRPMFGVTCLYRGKRIFAALPRTRTLGGPNSISFRFDPLPAALERRAKADERIRFRHPGARWYSFELISAEELNDALWWLGQAFEATR